MKFIKLIFLFFFYTLNIYAQQSWNLPLLSRWDDDNIPPAWTGAYSECTGYAANGREYAVIGSTQGSYFFEITNPYQPRLVNFFATRDTVVLVVNKDYATYSHYIYAVSDQGDNSLQIFDMQYLPDSVVKVYDNNAISKRCHTIFIEKERLYMASNTRPGNTFASMDIFSIADPLNPQLLGTLSNPGFYSVHETFVKNDTAYCANGNNGLWIYDLRNAAAPSLITIIDSYPESGYNHSAWLTADGKTMAFTDENHGRGVKLFDMNDIADPQLLSIFRSNMLQVSDPFSDNGSVAHNPYIVGNTLLVSYYHDGVQAYDITDPAHPVLKGYYDTFSQNINYYSYNGCWGLYPFLPSGNIIASDITNGLFILDGKTILNTPPVLHGVPSIHIIANAVSDDLQILIFSAKESFAKIEIYDVEGRLLQKSNYGVTEGFNELTFSLNSFAKGYYVIMIKSGEMVLTEKFVKIDK